MSNNHDTHDAAAGDHDGHGAGPEVEVESSPVDSAAPTRLSAFIWPGIIALLVLILVWGPITGAFSRFEGGRDANGQPTPTLVVPTPTEAGGEGTPTAALTTALTAVPTNAPGGVATLPPATD